MKNILLQHWTGEQPELVQKSVANMKKYAIKCGANYRLLEGNGFRPWLSTPCQKLWMLDEEFDEYDVVAMIDPDMFTRKGLEENLFTDVTGIGMYNEEMQGILFAGLRKRYPMLTDSNGPYWGGAIYRLEREDRQKMRKFLNDSEMTLMGNRIGNFNDEGIMHRIASLAKIPRQKLPGGFKWCHCSYREGIENSAMIHIRPKTTQNPPSGEKNPKIDNYYTLVERGLI